MIVRWKKVCKIMAKVDGKGTEASEAVEGLVIYFGKSFVFFILAVYVIIF